MLLSASAFMTEHDVCKDPCTRETKDLPQYLYHHSLDCLHLYKSIQTINIYMYTIPSCYLTLNLITQTLPLTSTRGSIGCTLDRLQALTFRMHHVQCNSKTNMPILNYEDVSTFLVIPSRLDLLSSCVQC